MSNLYNLPQVIGCPLCNGKADTSQPVKVVFETNQMVPNVVPAKTIADLEAVVAGFVSGLVYILNGTPLLLQVIKLLQESGRNVVCIVKDSWTTWATTQSTGISYPLNFSCGCDNFPLRFLQHPQGEKGGLVIYDINKIFSFCKGDVSKFQSKLKMANMLCKRENGVLLVEEAALKQGPANLLEAAISGVPDMVKVSSVA
jgi:hypothetical protein